MKAIMLLAGSLVLGTLLVAPVASADIYQAFAPTDRVVGGPADCSFASATVGSDVDFCSNLGRRGCTTLRVIGETFSWCD